MPVAAKRRPTAADVASLAGVSRETVSHILNGRDSRFPPATRERVRAAAQKLDYRPWPGARDIVEGRGSTIVIVLPKTMLGPNVQEAADQVARRLGRRVTNVVLRFADDDPGVTIDRLLQLNPLAVVDIGSLGVRERERLAGQGVPTVPDMNRPFHVNGMPVNDAIAALQLDALTSRGERRLFYATVAGDQTKTYGTARLDSLRRIAETRGLGTIDVIDFELTADSAAESLATFLRPGSPLGVAAYNDLVGAAVLGAAHRLGLTVPDDIAVVGVDGSEIAAILSPSLASVKVDMAAVMNASLTQLPDVLQGTPTDGIGDGVLIHLQPGGSV